LRERGRYIKGRVKSRKSSVSYHEPDQTFLEGVFARGDSTLGRAVLEAWRRGARFDGWTECFDIRRWEGVFRDLEIDASWFATRERARAFAESPTPDCANGECNDCGVRIRFALCGRANGA
jgi:hypothetical protein